MNSNSRQKKRGSAAIGGFFRKMAGLRERQADCQSPEDILRYPECGVAVPRGQVMSSLFSRLERCVEEKKLYLDPYINLSQLAKTVGSNRTYVSNILAPLKGFRYYMNECRLKHIALRLQKEDLEREPFILSEDEFLTNSKISGIVLTGGFTEMRTFRRALAASDGKWAKFIRERIY